MAALPKPAWSNPSSPIQALRLPSHIPLERSQPLSISGVFRGHRLYPARIAALSSGLASLDALIDGGIPHGKSAKSRAAPARARPRLPASFAAFATRRGEVAAWLDASGAFDPESMAAAGVELGRMLWASMKTTTTASRMARSTLPYARFAAGPLARHQSAIVKAAELVLEAGGFGLVVVDFGEAPRALAHASALRIARAAERSGAAGDRDRTVADVRDVRGAESGCLPRRDVVQPARSRLTGNVRRTCGGHDGGAEQAGRDGAACSRSRSR